MKTITNIILDSLYLEEIPEFIGEIDRVEGSFYTSYVELGGNNLKNLKNCPQYIDGALYCVDSKLRSLEGSPRIVTGAFNVATNQLTDLVGAPDEVFELVVIENPLTSLKGCTQNLVSFNASYCDLRSLVGGPTTLRSNPIKGHPQYYKVDYNRKLTSLEGAPTEAPGSFNASSCALENLIGAPEYVGRDFVVSFNPLKSLEGCPKRVGKDFFCKPITEDIKAGTAVRFTEEQIRSVCDVKGYVYVF
jgi:hypothetical protein